MDAMHGYNHQVVVIIIGFNVKPWLLFVFMLILIIDCVGCFGRRLQG